MNVSIFFSRIVAHTELILSRHIIWLKTCEMKTVFFFHFWYELIFYRNTTYNLAQTDKIESTFCFFFFFYLFCYPGEERDRGFNDIKTFRFLCCRLVMPPVILFLTSVAGFVLIKCNCLCLICVWLAVCSRNSARKNTSWALFRHCFGKFNEPNYLVAAYLVHNCDDRNSFRCVSHRQKFIQRKKSSSELERGHGKI